MTLEPTDPHPAPHDAMVDALIDAIEREPEELRGPMLEAIKGHRASVQSAGNRRQVVVDFRPAGIDRLVVATLPAAAPERLN